MLNNWDGYWTGGMGQHFRLQLFVLKRETSVLTIHPSKMVNKFDWDSIYYSKTKYVQQNPKKLIRLPTKSPIEVEYVFHKFDLLLKHLYTLKKTHLLEVTPKPTATSRILPPTINDPEKYYNLSIKWAQGYGYNPKFIKSHFFQFFEKTP